MNQFHYIYPKKSITIPTKSDFLQYKAFIIPIWDEYIINICTNSKTNKFNVGKLTKNLLYKYPGVEQYLSIRYKDSKSFSETIWRIKLKIEDRPKCPMCGNEVNYLGSGQYSEHCSNSCQMKNPKTKEKYHKNLLIKYGENVTNVFQLSKVKEKIKNTCLERYGVNYNLQNPTTREKIKNTCLEKYGVDNYAKTNECKEKIKNTCLEKYGEINPNKTKK